MLGLLGENIGSIYARTLSLGFEDLGYSCCGYGFTVGMVTGDVQGMTIAVRTLRLQTQTRYLPSIRADVPAIRAVCPLYSIEAP